MDYSQEGCSPLKFTTLIKLFHNDMTGEVLSIATFLRKQGCILTPVILNLFFIQVLLYCFRGLDLGIYIRYHLDGWLFDLQCLKAKTKTLERLTTTALFTDACTFITPQEYHLQAILDRFAKVSKVFCLTINLGKMEVLLWPAPNSDPLQLCITINSTQLKKF